MPLVIFALICLVAVIYTPAHIKQTLVDMPKEAWGIIWILGLGLCCTGTPLLVALGFCIVIAPVLFVAVYLMLFN